MHVLGLANTPNAEVDMLQVHATTGPALKTPQISCARASTIQIILFERPLPNRMQYISLNPISLALEDKAEMATHAPGSVDAEEEREEMKNRQRTKNLVEKLKLHTVVKKPPSQKEDALPRIVNQINCSWELHRLLQKNISLVGRRSRRSLSVSERVVESATTMRDFVVMAIWQLITVYIYPVLRRGFVVGLLCHRVVAEALLRVLEWRAKPDYAALKDISATAQQVEIRLQQFCYWPVQVSRTFLLDAPVPRMDLPPDWPASGWTCLWMDLPWDGPASKALFVFAPALFDTLQAAAPPTVTFFRACYRRCRFIPSLARCKFQIYSSLGIDGLHGV
jgi:phosphatidylinositol glycan class Q protein